MKKWSKKFLKKRKKDSPECLLENCKSKRKIRSLLTIGNFLLHLLARSSLMWKASLKFKVIGIGGKLLNSTVIGLELVNYWSLRRINKATCLGIFSSSSSYTFLLQGHRCWEKYRLKIFSHELTGNNPREIHDFEK